MAEGDIFRASVLAKIFSTGQDIVMDWGFVDKNSGTTVLDTGTAAGNFQTLVQAALLACWPFGVLVHRYRWACVGGPNVGQVGYVELDTPAEGTLSSDFILPAEMCISLKRNSGYASRKDRGRVFFGPVSSSLLAATGWDRVDTTITALHTLRDTLKATLTVSGRVLTPMILGRDPSPPHHAIVTGHTIINVGIGEVLVHRKSRRSNVGS